MPDGTTMPGATHDESMGQPQQQVDPAIQQITEFISMSINNGDDPIDVVMALVDKQVDQQTIAEVFMQVGYAQEDVVALFEQVQQRMQPPGPASPEEQTQDPQEIARNEAMTEESQMQQAKSGIEIKPENEGKFTAWAKARGMSVQEAASKVMSNKDEYPPSVVKMANFAKNAAGWNKKEGGEQKAYQPHFMYKGERKIRAKDMETHLRLKEAGYGHDAPKAQTGLEVDKKGNSFINGVVQSLDKFTSAPNYVNPLAFETGNNFSASDAFQVLGTGYNKLLGSNDKDGDGLQDGAFRDLKAKNAKADLEKGDYYNYKVELDENDPNAYGYDNLDLYNVSRGDGMLRDLQTFTDDTNKNSRVNFNTETGKYDFLQSSRELDESIYGNLNAFNGENLDYFNNLDAKTRQELLDFGNSDSPEGTTLSIDEKGRTGYALKDDPNPNRYNTMMGYNKAGVDTTLEPINFTQLSANNSSIMEVDNKLSFKEWSIQNGVTRMTANAQMQYQDYLNGQSSLKYGGSLPKAQIGMFDFTSNFNQDQLQDQEQYFSNMLLRNGSSSVNGSGTNYMQDTTDVADAQLQKANPGLGATPLQQSNQAMFQPQQNLDLSSFVQEEEEEPVVDLPEFNDPTVTRTNKLQGGIDRFLDNPITKAVTDTSEFLMQGSRVANNFFKDRAIEDAEVDNRNNMVADNLYSTNENPMLKRGAWDVNTGTFGSEGQRTVRTNYGIAQEGGEMATVDSLLLAKLIAAGADIEIL